jgi:hypothetical protein
MLQDLEYGRLENEFRHTAPVATAKVVCAQGSRLLVKRKKDDTLVLPTYAEVMAWAKEKGWTHWYENEVQYVFRMQMPGIPATIALGGLLHLDGRSRCACGYVLLL